jgi:hypothetical protein
VQCKKGSCVWVRYRVNGLSYNGSRTPTPIEPSWAVSICEKCHWVSAILMDQAGLPVVLISGQVAAQGDLRD